MTTVKARGIAEATAEGCAKCCVMCSWVLCCCPNLSCVRRSSGRTVRSNTRKLLAVGDDGCGKTALLCALYNGTFPETKPPRVVEDLVVDTKTKGKDKQYTLPIGDSGDGDDFDGTNRRLEFYADAHIILICFAINSADSLGNVEAKWISEVLAHRRGFPVILVGCKSDLRDDPETNETSQETGGQLVSPAECDELRRRIGANRYVECSAKSKEGVQELFDCVYAVSGMIDPRAQKRKGRLGDMKHPMV